MAAVPSTLDDVDTPAMLIDRAIVAENIARAQKYADAHGLRLRPHIKTHKIGTLAAQQLAAGAAGINCQKVSEAEAMLDAIGARDVDVLITFNIVGERKLARAMELAKRARLTLVADSAFVVEGYARAAAKAGVVLSVMVECDTGGLRAGVTSPEQALALAQTVLALASLRFAGLMTFPAKHAVAALAEWIAAARRLFEAAGAPLPAVTVGGTSDAWQMHEIEGLTEMRPGTYIYNDGVTVHAGAAEWEHCAQTVLATVVSRPTPTRVVVDAGSKALSMDQHPAGGYGRVVGYPAARVDRLSEEHGVIEADEPSQLPPLGARIRIVPNHSCCVTNLFNEAVFVEGDSVVAVTPISARGCVY